MVTFSDWSIVMKKWSRNKIAVNPSQISFKQSNVHIKNTFSKLESVIEI